MSISEQVLILISVRMYVIHEHVVLLLGKGDDCPLWYEGGLGDVLNELGGILDDLMILDELRDVLYDLGSVVMMLTYRWR